MAMLGAGLGADIREMPEYCRETSFDPPSWFRGVIPACSPYTLEELEAMTSSQMTQACTVNGVVDEECRARGISSARQAAEAAARTDVEGTCEYNAVQEWPAVSRVLGPATVCKIREGRFNALFLAGAVVVLALFVGRKG